MKAAVLMITRKCNMSCAHCSVASHPGISEEPSPETLRRAVMEMGEAGVIGIQYTGGEPLIRHRLLFELMELAQTRYGMGAAIVSNGFWGKKPERAREFFQKMVDLGLMRLTISYDRFHAKFMGPEPVCNILEVARARQWPVNINVTRTAQDGELGELLAPFTSYKNASFRFYDVQPVGEAEKLGEELRAQIDGFSSGCEQATVCDNGRMAACNGPAYFEPDESALILGRTDEKSLTELLLLHDEDPILQTIRLEGPIKLKETLESLPGFADFPFKKQYSGMCELCRQICRDPEAVAALREELSKPEKTALRVAQFHVKKAARANLWHRDAINSTEARRVLFLALCSEPEKYEREIEQILSRADVDWYRLAQMVVRNGLAGKLRSRRRFFRHAPDLFWDFLDGATREPKEHASLSALLWAWQESDFEDILALAVSLDKSEGWLDELRADRSVLGGLASKLLECNGLIRPRFAVEGYTNRLWSLRSKLGQAVITPLPYRHSNLFLKPGLHLLCLDNPGLTARCFRLAVRSFAEAFKHTLELRGREETFQFLAKDFLAALKALKP